jgi:hypothetical protein
VKDFSSVCRGAVIGSILADACIALS